MSGVPQGSSAGYGGGAMAVGGRARMAKSAKLHTPLVVISIAAGLALTIDPRQTGRVPSTKGMLAV